MLVFVHRDLKPDIAEQFRSQLIIAECFDRRSGVAQEHCHAKYFGRWSAGHFSKDLLKKPRWFHIGC